MPTVNTHRIKQPPDPGRVVLPRHVLESRIEQGRRFRAMYRTLGWSRVDCVEFLYLTERCLCNWEAGRRPVPFAAYKLLRLHLGYELPGSAWRGWSVSRGKLCMLEGYEFSPHDAAWWSLLVRRAEVGARALRQLHEVNWSRQADATGAGVTGGGASGAPARGAAAPASLTPEAGETA